MSEIKLSDIDLNLLYILQVLTEELNVTKAAIRLEVSQPAVSRSLSRLREIFDDPLFVRNSHGLTPTAKTQSLEPILATTLRSLENLVQPKQFTPATSQRRFTLSTTDFGILTVLPQIFEPFRQAAPQATLDIKAWNEDTTLAWDKLDVDIAVAVLSKETSSLVRSKRLMSDRLVCLARKDHPSVEHDLTLDSYLAAGHVQVVLGKREYFAVDRELEKMNARRHVALQLPNFVPAARVVLDSDLLLTVPELFAKDMVENNPELAIFELPFLEKKFDYSMVWHERFQHDAAHLWFRGLLEDAFIK